MNESNNVYSRVVGKYFTIEIDDNVRSCNHRLVDNKTGKSTAWAGYTQITAMDASVGVSPYYTGDEFKIMDANQFVHLIAVK